MMRALPLIAVPLALLAATSGANAPGPPDPLKAARAEQGAAEREAARLGKAAEAARGTARKLAADQLAAAADLAAAEARISTAGAELALRRAEVAAVEQRLAERQAPIAGLVAGLVNMGRRPPMLAILDGQSPDEMVRVRALLDSTIPEIRRRSAELRREVERGRQLKAEAEQAATRLAEAREALSQRRTRLAALETRALERAAILGSGALNADDRVIAAEERNAALDSDAKRTSSARKLAADLALLEPARARPVPAEGQTSRPALAYRLPVAASVTEGSGAVSDSGIAARGIAFDTPRGTPVTMPAAGTIAFAAPHGRHDGVVIIDHGAGWMTLMTGVRAGVPKGTRLAAGAPLGKALGPVGVELSINGRPVSAAMVAARRPVTGR